MIWSLTEYTTMAENKNKQMRERERERERDLWRELKWNVFPQLNQYNHQDRLYSIITSSSFQRLI